MLLPRATRALAQLLPRSRLTSRPPPLLAPRLLCAAASSPPPPAASAETVRITFVEDGEDIEVDVPVGNTLLQAAQDNDIDLEGAPARKRVNPRRSHNHVPPCVVITDHADTCAPLCRAVLVCRRVRRQPRVLNVSRDPGGVAL